MIEVCGVPIVGWQLSWLAKHDIRRAIISIGYLKQVVMDYVGTGGKFGVKVEYSEEGQSVAGDGALKTTRDLLRGENDRFLCDWRQI